MSATTSDTATEVLASPFTINTLTVKNRIVLGPMAVLRPTADGRPSEQTIAFLTRRARGGAGLIIVGGSVASDRAWNESPFFPNIRFDKDEFVPDLARIVDAVHAARRADLRAALPELRPHGRAAQRCLISAASPKPVDFGSGGLPDHCLRPRRPRHARPRTRRRWRRSRPSRPTSSPPRAARRPPASTASRSPRTCATSTRRSSRRWRTSAPTSTAAPPRTVPGPCATRSRQSAPRSAPTTRSASG